MAFLDTEYKRKSAVMTTLVMALLIFLMFVLGLKYFDPPLEYGIAVNFGTSDVGSGNVQPTEPLQSAPEQVTEETAQEQPEETVEETPAEKAVENTPAEKVLTQDNAESIKIKQQEEARKKAEEAERQKRLEEERIAREKREKRGSLIDSLVKLLEKDRLEVVFTQLATFLEKVGEAGESLADDLLLLSNRHKRLERKLRQGVLVAADAGVETNQIRLSLLELLKEAKTLE